MRTEVVHLRRAVHLDHQHVIQTLMINRAHTVYADADGMEIAGGRRHVFHPFDLNAIFDLDDVRRIDNAVGSTRHWGFPEGERPHPRVLDFDRPLVIHPLLVLPELHAEGAGFGIAQALAVVHPDSRFAGKSGIALAQFERCEQAQLQGRVRNPRRNG